MQSEARRSRPFSDNPLNFAMLISTEMANLSNFSNPCFVFYWKGFPLYFQSCQRYILTVFWYSNLDVNLNYLENKLEGKSSLCVPISKSWEEGRMDGQAAFLWVGGLGVGRLGFRSLPARPWTTRFPSLCLSFHVYKVVIAAALLWKKHVNSPRSRIYSYVERGTR